MAKKSAPPLLTLRDLLDALQASPASRLDQPVELSVYGREYQIAEVRTAMRVTQIVAVDNRKKLGPTAGRPTRPDRGTSDARP